MDLQSYKVVSTLGDLFSNAGYLVCSTKKPKVWNDDKLPKAWSAMMIN